MFCRDAQLSCGILCSRLTVRVSSFYWLRSLTHVFSAWTSTKSSAVRARKQRCGQAPTPLSPPDPDPSEFVELHSSLLFCVLVVLFRQGEISLADIPGVATISVAVRFRSVTNQQRHGPMRPAPEFT